MNEFTGLKFSYPMINTMIDIYVYLMLQFYFVPANLMRQSTEVDKWIY